MRETESVQLVDDNEQHSAPILAVVDTELLESDSPESSAFCSRVVQVARVAGREIELFHPCSDLSWNQRVFLLDPMVENLRQDRANQAATRLAELALKLKARGVSCKHDVRLDVSGTNAILHKIQDCKPSLVLKAARKHGFYLGLIANDEWDLVRQSPANIWFVKDDDARIDTVVTAIGTASHDDDIISPKDYQVFQTAQTITEWFGATHVPVHAYQVPVGLGHSYAKYAPYLGGVPVSPRSMPDAGGENKKQDVAEEHGRLIRNFAEFFGFEPENIQLEAGHPSEVVPRCAASVGADLVVMGARNLGHWERATGSVIAEPVLAETPCDVLFVKEDSDAREVIENAVLVEGTPAVDLEHAIARPEEAFDSPRAVTEISEVSVEVRKRILDAWEQDARAQLVEDDEGGPVKPTNKLNRLLQDIGAARSALAATRTEYMENQR